MNVDPLSTTKSKVGLNVREDIQATWSSFFRTLKSRLGRLTKKECLDMGRVGRYINNLKNSTTNFGTPPHYLGL